MPNPAFAGTGGVLAGAATGVVPDDWRAFAVGGGATDVSIIPLPADALYPGSPATRAVKLEVSAFGTDQGFDHDNTRFAVTPDKTYRFEVYVKTANPDESNQKFGVAFPLFDAGGYLGRAPGGAGNKTATATWTRFAGPAFSDPEATEAHIAFRLQNDGGPNAILAALPAVEGSPPGDVFTPPSAEELAQRMSWTTADKLVGTTYFYWYRFPDLHFYDDGAHTDDALTDHFVVPETVSMESRCWHKKEASDMIDAGIDMLWPVYWAAPGNFTHPHFKLYVEGLLPLQEALDELAGAGRDPPKIGMFYDTSSLLNSVRGQSPAGGKADLTTPEGKVIFYETIRSFFATVHPRHWACIDGRPLVVLYTSAFAARYDASTFAHLNAQFAAEFGGITPYIIRELSWNAPTDSSYRWGAALGGPHLDGIAAIGAGYDDTAVPGRFTPIRMRENGNFYRWSWLQVLASDRRIVHLETWNEMHEGTSLCESAEYGRQYIDLTAQYVAHFKAGTIPNETVELVYEDPQPRPPNLDDGAEYADADSVEIRADAGAMIEAGVDYRENTDGVVSIVQHAGDTFLRAEGSGSNRYAYFAVKDPYYFDLHRGVEITIEYLDKGGALVALQYDSHDESATASGAYKSGPSFTAGNLGNVQSRKLIVSDARFANRQNGGADFRLYVDNGPVHIKRIVVRKLSEPAIRVHQISPPSGAVLGGAPERIVVTFSGFPNPATVNPDSFQLWRSGGDGVFLGGRSDVLVHEGVREAGGPEARLVLGDVALPNDVYRVFLPGDSGQSMTDYAGNRLDGEFYGTFPSGDGVAGGDFVSTFSIARIPGDLDADFDVDVDDAATFASCFTGHGVATEGRCAYADADEDGDVDCDDWAAFQAAWADPDPPPDLPACVPSVPIVATWRWMAPAAIAIVVGVWIIVHRQRASTVTSSSSM